MDTYCINLDERPDRWHRMQAVAEQAGINLIRIKAVGPEDVARMTAAKEPDMAGGFGSMDARQIGCALSHLSFWRALLASGADMALVLEDDVLLAGDFAEFLAKLRWPAGVGLMRVEASQSLVTLDRIRKLEGSSRKFGRLLSSQCGTGGYVLTRSAAEKLVMAFDGMPIPVDLYLLHPKARWQRELNVCQVFPAPVQQGCFVAAHVQEAWSQSSITPDFTNDMSFDAISVGGHERRRPLRSLARDVRAIVRKLRGRTRVAVNFG